MAAAHHLYFSKINVDSLKHMRDIAPVLCQFFSGAQANGVERDHIAAGASAGGSSRGCRWHRGECEHIFLFNLAQALGCSISRQTTQIDAALSNQTPCQWRHTDIIWALGITIVANRRVHFIKRGKTFRCRINHHWRCWCCCHDICHGGHYRWWWGCRRRLRCTGLAVKHGNRHSNFSRFTIASVNRCQLASNNGFNFDSYFIGFNFKKAVTDFNVIANGLEPREDFSFSYSFTQLRHDNCVGHGLPVHHTNNLVDNTCCIRQCQIF